MMLEMPGLWHTHPHLVAPVLLLLLMMMMMMQVKAKRNMHNAAEQPGMKLDVTA
jgi:hypothetical protein